MKLGITLRGLLLHLLLHFHLRVYKCYGAAGIINAIRQAKLRAPGKVPIRTPAFFNLYYRS